MLIFHFKINYTSSVKFIKKLCPLFSTTKKLIFLIEMKYIEGLLGSHALCVKCRVCENFDK